MRWLSTEYEVCIYSYMICLMTAEPRNQRNASANIPLLALVVCVYLALLPYDERLVYSICLSYDKDHEWRFLLVISEL